MHDCEAVAKALKNQTSWSQLAFASTISIVVFPEEFTSLTLFLVLPKSITTPYFELLLAE